MIFLKNVAGSFEHNVKNSYDVLNKLKSVVLPQGYSLISLDVKSLFTNIPEELVVIVYCFTSVENSILHARCLSCGTRPKVECHKNTSK